MRVRLFNADTGGCGHYRMLYPGNALADDPNVDVSFSQTLGKAMIDRNTGAPMRLEEEPDYDVAVFQRPFALQVALSIPMLQQVYGVACVVEMDDDAEHIPPDHPGHGILHNSHPEFCARNAFMAAQMADLVIVSTPALRSVYGAHGRVRVLRNCVPDYYFEPALREHADLWVGWTGASVASVHRGDLDVCRDAIARAMPPLTRFACWDDDGAARKLAIPREATVVRDWVPLDEGRFHREIQQLDVGIAPLRLNRFNEAKSALRGIEYAACGVPFVASPTAEYRVLADMGVGQLAEKASEWKRAVGALMRSPELRAEMAGVGQEVAAALTYERNAHYWAEAWEQALQNARKAVNVKPTVV